MISRDVVSRRYVLSRNGLETCFWNVSISPRSRDLVLSVSSSLSLCRQMPRSRLSLVTLAWTSRLNSTYLAKRIGLVSVSNPNVSCTSGVCKYRLQIKCWCNHRSPIGQLLRGTLLLCAGIAVICPFRLVGQLLIKHILGSDVASTMSRQQQFLG